MKTVYLIGTYHEERGRANVPALHALLERIQPDVIFLEAPAEWGAGRRVHEKTDGLESRAISLYVSERSVDVVPVDLPTPDESFFRMHRYLFGDLPKSSYEYYRLLEEHKEHVISEGFRYLNSEIHSQVQLGLHAETLKILERLKNAGFSEFYETWQRKNESRDREMVLNIGRYCRANEFFRAVFLVGAAHRASIVEKAESQFGANRSEIQWDYSGKGAW